MTHRVLGNIVRDKAVGAILGAACGDALGWPNERIHRPNSKKRLNNLMPEFRSWNRRPGGRFYPYVERVEGGAYSDDTQLILCLCRCLRRGSDWWEHWTEVELPFWTLYERGGGGATKRAANAWANGDPPWSSRQNHKLTKMYFEAGGNGVAMRVLPHVLCLASCEEYRPIAENIMLDGICTHGHPRALVGALAYGYALWKSLRRESRLGYGEITRDLLDNGDEWSRFPDMSPACSGWLEAADQFFPDHHRVWDATVQETESLFSTCRSELNKGALTIDDETLMALGCFERKESGAGTIAAAAAVFLASRYAPDPIHGVIKAAFALGADTDTIASMTGGLLGMVCGSAWLSPLKDRVQDSSYLIESAQSILDQESRTERANDSLSTRRSSLDVWIKDLFAQTPSSSVLLPDGRKGFVHVEPNQTDQRGRFVVQFRKVVSEDGQSLFFKKISQGESYTTRISSQRQQICRGQDQQLTEGVNFGPKLPVESLQKAVRFYRDLLGFTIKKELKEATVFDKGLVLVPRSYCTEQLKGVQLRTLLYIEVADIERRFALVKDSGVEIITPVSPWGKTLRVFRCSDPDGNIVEVFSADRQV